jgi:membrane-anchored glycerophosphoryl diester phosphodiesterase (GDPDase)
MSLQYKVSAAQIFSNLSDVAIRHVKVWGLAVLLMAVLYTAVDILLGRELGTLSSVLNLFVSYYVTEVILREEGRLGTSYSAYGSLFGASLLSALGIGLGFVLLIIPGLYCLARWSLVTPLIVGEGMGAIAAMSESWERTTESVWAIVSVYLVYVITFVVAVGMLAFSGLAVSDEQGALPLEAAGLIIPFVENLTAVTLGMAGTLIAIAVYRALSGTASTYDDVFS